MSRLLFLISLFAIAAAWPLHAAEEFLVRDGQPQAEIIIAEHPQRTVRLAAHDLQTYVEKISGAHLPIATQPTGGRAGANLCGPQPCTDQLKVTADGLKVGAYRIVSGDHWLVLIGDDTDFTPIEPWAKNNADIASGKRRASGTRSPARMGPARAHRCTRAGSPCRATSAGRMRATREDASRGRSGAATSAARSMRSPGSCSGSACAGTCRASWARSCRR